MTSSRSSRTTAAVCWLAQSWSCWRRALRNLENRVNNKRGTIMPIRSYAPVLALLVSACNAAPEKESALPAERIAEHVAGRSRAQHYNHWSPVSAGGMGQNIGNGTFYANCADWNLWDMAVWEANAYGFHSYRTKNATTTHDSNG